MRNGSEQTLAVALGKAAAPRPTDDVAATAEATKPPRGATDQRNSHDENDEVKAGNTPDAWKRNPAKNRQKDKDARWTKKHGKSFYGYKNHVNADAKHTACRQICCQTGRRSPQRCRSPNLPCVPGSSRCPHWGT
jgi:hypothetical protein